jgi:hypothetical protein
VQTHDFNPGFGPAVGPNGARTFWTVPIDDQDVAVQFVDGKAEMHVNNLAMPDYGTKNPLRKNWQTAFDPGVVSFDVVWSPPITRRLSVANGTLGNHYAGEYVENQVTVTWSGTNLRTGFTFTSNPGTFATSSVDGGFAELGHERNGSFFQASADPSASNAGASLSLPSQMWSFSGTTGAAGVQSSAALSGNATNPSGDGQGAKPAAGFTALTSAIPPDVWDQLFGDLGPGW